MAFGVGGAAPDAVFPTFQREVQARAPDRAGTADLFCLLDLRRTLGDGVKQFRIDSVISAGGLLGEITRVQRTEQPPQCIGAVDSVRTGQLRHLIHHNAAAVSRINLSRSTLSSRKGHVVYVGADQ